MKTTECIHKEHMKTGGNHTEIGECQYCGQTVVYDRAQLRAIPVTTKLGRLDGKLVLPKPTFKLDLDAQDQADLTADHLQAASSKHPLAGNEPAAEIPPRPGKDDPKGRLEWFRKHKKQLIESLLHLGPEIFIRKYNLHRLLVSRLKADKYYKKLAEKTPPAPGAEPAARVKAGQPKAPKGDIPPLPTWSDDWAPEVQVAWLNIFQRHYLK